MLPVKTGGIFYLTAFLDPAPQIYDTASFPKNVDTHKTSAYKQNINVQK